MMNRLRAQLPGLIREFLAEFAGRDARDPAEFSSPDAAEFERFAAHLESLRDAPPSSISLPHSEWGSGGYKPYLSTRGRSIHDGLLHLCAAVHQEHVCDD